MQTLDIVVTGSAAYLLALLPSRPPSPSSFPSPSPSSFPNHAIQTYFSPSYLPPNPSKPRGPKILPSTTTPSPLFSSPPLPSPLSSPPPSQSAPARARVVGSQRHQHLSHTCPAKGRPTMPRLPTCQLLQVNRKYRTLLPLPVTTMIIFCNLSPSFSSFFYMFVHALTHLFI